jgi:hypothetical protein
MGIVRDPAINEPFIHIKHEGGVARAGYARVPDQKEPVAAGSRSADDWGGWNR